MRLDLQNFEIHIFKSALVLPPNELQRDVFLAKVWSAILLSGHGGCMIQLHTLKVKGYIKIDV